MPDRSINQASGPGSKATLTATAKLRSIFRMLQRIICQPDMKKAIMNDRL